MTSRADLETAVVAAMARAGEAPMQWGVDDCALWVANALREPLGYDPAERQRGRYKTRRGAMRVAGRSGLLDQIRNIARRRDWKRIDPALAQTGDVGMVWTVYGGRAVLATAMCRARGWFVARDEAGFSAVPASRVALAWSVLPDALASGPGPRVSLRHWRTDEPVPADPISIAILTTVGIEATATAVAVTTAIISIGASFGLSLLSSLLQPHNGSTLSDNSIANTAQSAFTERQSIPFKQVIVGSAYIGGAMFYEQVKPPYLTMGILINYGPIAGVDKVFIGTDQLQFNSIVPNTILNPLAITGQKNYAANLRVSFRYGSNSQAVDPLILARYPNVGATFQQCGISTAVFEYAYGGADQNAFIAMWGQVQRPTAYMVVRGVVAYDPRDPTQSLTDETTWKWTNNASLVQAWYLTRSFGGRIPKANIAWDRVSVSADWDDTLMGCNDGTLIKKHTIDGVVTLNQQPFQVMQQLLTANRGMILESGGRIWVQSSYPKTPVVTIHDRMLAGGLNYQSAKQKSDLTNKVQVRFIAPDQAYQIVDGPLLDRSDLQAIDAEVLPATLALNYTQDHRRAQRLQNCFLETSRLGRTITCNVDIRLMAIASDELIGAAVTVDSQLFSSANGTYVVTAQGLADDTTTLSLALTEYDSTIETRVYTEQPFTLAAINTA